MESSNSKLLKSKLNKMATTGKKRKKRAVKRSTTLRSAPQRKAVTRRKRKRGLSANGQGGLMVAGKNAIGGAVGGALFTLPSLFMKLPLWGKIVYGLTGAVVLSVMKFDHVGAGLSGAMVNDIARSQFPTMLNDGMEDTEFVNPNTLSETGMEDGNGNSIVADGEGVVYALNDNGDYQAIGTKEQLFQLQDDAVPMVNRGMIPLNDVYSLNDRY
jgi:hypothetical protein